MGMAYDGLYGHVIDISDYMHGMMMDPGYGNESPWTWLLGMVSAFLSYHIA
jgi:heme/copper-type cytochrome/quinol oxidase subunit 1